jgi:glycosyltransferase involved in cell wall biosynthesis
MNSDRTDFSVIITSHNYISYIEEAIRSVLGQTHVPLQIIVVDDGSTDGTPELLQQKYATDARIELVFKPNGGQLSAFRAGIEHCKGDLEHLGRAYQSRREVDFVCANLSFFGAKAGMWRIAEAEVDHGITVLAALYGREWVGAPTSAISLRRGLATRILRLPADFDTDWRTRADDCLVIGASAYGARKLLLPTATVNYRMHTGNAWLGRASDGVAALHYELRRARLAHHYRGLLGIDEEILIFTMEEFRTRPEIARAERRMYIRLVLRARLSFWRKLANIFEILRAHIIYQALSWKKKHWNIR